MLQPYQGQFTTIKIVDGFKQPARNSQPPVDPKFPPLNKGGYRKKHTPAHNHTKTPKKAKNNQKKPIWFFNRSNQMRNQ
jgi:hypothetical protein